MPVTFGGGSTITNFPSGFTSPSAVNSGLKKPSFSHHEYHADSTAIGLYAWYCGSSNDLRIFFSPNGVSSTYGGRTSFSAFSAAFAFFSLFLLGPSAGLAAAACFFFASNLACFSAFLRSLSSSFSLFTFFSPAGAATPGACCPVASVFVALATAAAVSGATAGGFPVTGPVGSPTKFHCQVHGTPRLQLILTWVG